MHTRIDHPAVSSQLDEQRLLLNGLAMLVHYLARRACIPSTLHTHASCNSYGTYVTPLSRGRDCSRALAGERRPSLFRHAVLMRENRWEQRWYARALQFRVYIRVSRLPS